MKKEGALYDRVQERLVCSLLAEGAEHDDVFDALTPEDFTIPRYSVLFRALADAHREGRPLDLVSVAEFLENRGELGKVGGTQELFSMRQQGREFQLEAPIKHYARIAKEQSAKFHSARLLNDSVSKFSESSGWSASEAITGLQEELGEILTSVINEESITTMDNIENEMMERLEERKAQREENEKLGTGGLLGIPTLLPTLDKYTYGFRGGQMITVGAQTGVGKSFFAINCAVAAAQANKSVLFFSLEMTNDEVQERIISCVTGIPTKALSTGDVYRLGMLKEGLEEVSRLKITIDDSPDQTIDSVMNRAVKQAQQEAGLDMIIIDYLQLINPPKHSTNRQLEVANMSRQIKKLAKKLDVPIMVVVQLVRPDKEHVDDQPTLYEIRESGAIANDSDIVILLHRRRTPSEGLGDVKTNIILEKNRGGRNNIVIPCNTLLGQAIFTEVTRDEDLPEMSEDDFEAVVDSEMANLDDIIGVDDE